MTLSVGLVGAGRMGGRHLQAVAGLEDVAVTGICDIAPGRARAFAEHFGGRAYTSLEEMIGREDLDALYVCNPVRHHGEAVRHAVERGIHIFVEKPLTLDLREGLEMVEAVEDAGVVCAAGYQYRYQRVLEKVREAVDGAPISLVHGYWYWTAPPVAATWDKEISGGPVVDQMTHLIDLARMFAGEVERVSAEYTLNTRRDEGFNNWDGSSVSLRFRDGAIGSFSSTLSLYPSLIHESNIDHMGLDLFVRDRMVSFRPDRATVYREHNVTEWTGLGGDIDREFIEACKLGDPALVRSPIRESYRTLAVCLACNEAANRGESVEMEEFISERSSLL